MSSTNEPSPVSQAVEKYYAESSFNIFAAFKQRQLPSLLIASDSEANIEKTFNFRSGTSLLLAIKAAERSAKIS
ncbi:hypothetical protein ACQ4M3_34300 [Leptolyngbya sp. AN03gr2]|uniref:hypothetical protein n=1 Tax=unclassified Leptolyngbya TaxID=2650499 RepID=UPI003D3125F0